MKILAVVFALSLATTFGALWEINNGGPEIWGLIAKWSIYLGAVIGFAMFIGGVIAYKNSRDDN